MSRELINRITLKKDGVYVSTHSSNDTSSYHSVKSNFLTECYKKDGKKGLDIGIIDRCLDNWELKGNHQSVIPYRLAIHKAFEYKKFIIIYYNCCELEEKVFDIANGFGEYKNYSTDERKQLLIPIKNELTTEIQKRNDFILDVLNKETKEPIEIVNNDKDIEMEI